MADTGSGKKRRPMNVGERYGRLVSIEFVRREGKTYYWKYKCDCGSEVIARPSLVRSGNTRSCGCLQKETAANTGRARAVHGLFGTPEWHCWQKIRARCDNERNSRFHIYGARGIKVCERWYTFENFYADMGPRPSSKHSIDRINVNGNYEPENCRWATTKEQARNKRNNIMVEFHGRQVCLKEAAEMANVKYMMVWKRIFLHGWPVALALTEPRRR